MTLQLGGAIGAAATLLTAITALIVAYRRSGSESDDHWQARVREQLEWQIKRNNELSLRVAELERAINLERRSRLQIEEAMSKRIATLELRLRVAGLEAG